MMQFQTGTADHPDINKALKNAANGLPNSARLVIATVPAQANAAALVYGLRTLFPEAALHIATSCLGSMTQAGSHLGAGTLSLASIADESGAYGSAAGSAPDGNLETLGKTLLAKAIEDAGRAGELPALVWLSSSPGTEERLVKILNEELGGQTPIYGGSSADDHIGGTWWVSDRSGPHSQGTIVSVMYPNARVLHAFHSGYAPTSIAGIVTEGEGRMIKSIDHQPAAVVYNQWTEGAISPFLKGGRILAASTLYPLAVQVGVIGEVPYHRLIHPERILDDGTIALFAEAPQGTRLELLRGSESSLLNRAGRVAAAAAADDLDGQGPIVGALITYCAGCMLAVQPKLSMVVDGLCAQLPGVPFLGQFTFGEQGTFPGGEACHGNLMISAVLFRSIS